MKKINGCIVVDKPQGMTSHDVVYRLRKIFSMKKIGHTGTLDPDTTGVLVMCLGEGTKLIQYLPESYKTYNCTISIGSSTTTEDASGEILEKVEVEDIDLSVIDDALCETMKITEQVPPMYSAIKVEGKKLYELARKNIEIERKPRPVEIKSITRKSETVMSEGNLEFSFTVTGSKGFYVRSLCVTIGKLLGYPAHMKELRRISSGNFTVDDASTIDDIAKGKFNLIKMQDMVPFDRYNITEESLRKVSNGMKLPNINGFKDFVFIIHDDTLLALYKSDGDYLKAVKVFYYGNN